MYPLSDGQIYPRQQWYIAAWSAEVGRTLFERKILNEPVAFFRTEAGDPVALAGLCPHRLFPLAKGKLVSDTVECAYHGFTFDRDGTCVAVPTYDKVPSTFKTKRYPLEERGSLVWIWMGDPNSADMGLIPDTTSIGIGAENWQVDQVELYNLKARYQLLIDNLMDLSHISFVHEASVPEGKYIAATPAEIDASGHTFRVKRRFPEMPIHNFAQFMHPDLSGQIVESWLTSDYLCPALINAGGPYIRRPGDSEIRQLNFIHGITPESPHSTHYFTLVARNFRVDDLALSDILKQTMKQVVDEDIGALEALEPYVNDRGDVQNELTSKADSGSVQVRRMLIAQIHREQNNQ